MAMTHSWSTSGRRREASGSLLIGNVLFRIILFSVHVCPGPSHMSLREGNFWPILSILKVNGTALSKYLPPNGWMDTCLINDNSFQMPSEHSTYTHPMYYLWHDTNRSSPSTNMELTSVPVSLSSRGLRVVLGINTMSPENTSALFSEDP